jgi:hypothetical protein
LKKEKQVNNDVKEESLMNSKVRKAMNFGENSEPAKKIKKSLP